MTADDDLVGKTFAGRFTITSRIGEGGMAAVYRATRSGTAAKPAADDKEKIVDEPTAAAAAEARDEPDEVALKVMNANLAADGAFVKRFRREAKAAARLHHPSIVAIYDHGVEEGLPYIAMELIQGAELVSILHHEKRLPEARAARIVAQMLSALAAAHEIGIVHRDLKPENVMICRDRKDPTVELVKVLDFGIAKLVEPEIKTPTAEDEEPPSSRAVLTVAGTVVGTPEYMSPEQSRGAAVDARSDIYSCGVMLYQLVTGRVPFAGNTYFETALMHVHDAPLPPREIVSAINGKLDALILKALSKAPEDRPQTAREMQADLLEMVGELSSERPKVSAPPPGPPRPAAGAPGPAAGAPAPAPPRVVAASARAGGAEPRVLTPIPDSDDARTRVMPAANERGPRDVLASAPEDVFAATMPGDALVPAAAAATPKIVMPPAPAVSIAEPPPTERGRPMPPLMALAIGIGLGAVVVLIGVVVVVVMR